MFFIGVLGAILFAVSNASLAYLVKALHEGHLRAAGSERPLAGAASGWWCFSRCAAWATTSPIIFRVGWGDRSSRACATICFSTSCACRSPYLGSTAIRTPAVQTDQQYRTGRGRRHQCGHLAHQRYLEHRDSARISVLFELASRRFLHRRGAGDRLADADRKPQLPALQPAHPKLDGRYHAGREGSHRRACV